MAKKQWTLVDVSRDVFLDDWEAGGAKSLEGVQGFSIRKRTLRGGLRDGLSIVELDNGATRLVVLPDRGMGLWRAWSGDMELGWPSPVAGPVNPRFVNLDEPSGIGWLAGFDELLARCGLESNGAPEFGPGGVLQYPLHGRIANQPARKLELTYDDDSGELQLTGEVDEARLYCSKLRLTSTVIMRRGEAGFTVHDRVTNLSTSPGEFELLYHINIGAPFLGPGSRVEVPAKMVIPRDPPSCTDVNTWTTYGEARPGAAEYVFYFKLAADAAGNTCVMLCRPGGKQAVTLAFNLQGLPQFVVWKNHQPPQDGYCTGLEPAINLPNVRSYEQQQGRVKQLAPGETYDCRPMHFNLLSNSADVEKARSEIRALTGGAAPQVFATPQPGWSPSGESS